MQATYTELIERVLMSQPESLRRSVEEKMREQHPDPDAFDSMMDFRHAAEAIVLEAS